MSLSDTVEEACISLIQAHTPQQLWARGITNIEVPLNPDRAKALRKRLRAIHYAWTGCDLCSALHEDDAR